MRKREQPPKFKEETYKITFLDHTIVKFEKIEENLSQYMAKNEPLDKELYNKLKDKVWKMYEKPSAYRSGMLVRLYREAGGQFSGQKPKHDGLPLWFDSKWLNQRGEVGYKYKSDVHRPTVRVNSKTSTTFQELTPEEIERARREKYKKGRVKKFKD